MANDEIYAARQRAVIESFRATGGRGTGQNAGLRLLLLTTIGRRSGRPHTVPLTWLGSGRDAVVVAANGGRGSEPDWYRNLRSSPRLTVDRGDGEAEVVARTATGAERAALLAAFAAENPQLGGYQASAPGFEVPVVVLSPLERGSAFAEPQ